MGNNLVLTLAIIYMNHLDEGIKAPFESNLRLKRYIDDMFICWSTDDITVEMVLTTANNLNPALKFTVEIPQDNRLPFLDTLDTLDTLVILHPEDDHFTTTLCTKPIHSQYVTPWDSHGPISQKRGILIGEIRRAISRSNDPQSQRSSLRLLTKLYIKNGYPKSFVRSTINKMLRQQKTPPSEEQEQGLIYIKVPFINEDLKQQTQSIIKRTGLNYIRIHYIGGSSSARIFTPSKEKQCCPDNCDTCSFSRTTNRCLTKNCVYKIKCSHCNSLYIGETNRTIGSRIKEHEQMKNQTVYVHLATHNNEPSLNDISWEFIHKNINEFHTRKIIETPEICKHKNIINGCIGRNLSLE